MSGMPTEIQGRPLHDLGGPRRWGRDYAVLEAGVEAQFVVFRKARFRKGDFLAVPTQPGGEARSLYRITKVNTPSDPGDQHFIYATHLKWGDVGITA